MMKTCSKCKAEKPFEAFSKCAKSKSGLQSRCKECFRAYYEENGPTIRARVSRWAAANRAKHNENGRHWAEENSTKVSAKARREREENPAQFRERRRRYSEQNPDKERARKRRWRKENPEKARAEVLRRRARKATAAIGDAVELRRRVSGIYTEPCAHCGTTENIHVDHIWPLSKGGAHAAYNLQALCGSCNSKKGNKLPLLLEAAN
jgi:5-methylcytosine-specific restriction endonuclease McrA